MTNSFNPMQAPDPNFGSEDNYNRSLQGLQDLQESALLDVSTDLKNKTKDTKLFEELGAFSETLTNIGTSIFKDVAADRIAEGMRQARINGVNPNELLELDEVTSAAAEFSGEVNKLADATEAQEGNSVVANRLRSNDPYTAYGYMRSQIRMKAEQMPNAWAQATRPAEEGGITVTDEFGANISYYQITEPEDFAEFEAEFERRIYKNFDGVSAAVMNEDVFPAMERLISEKSFRWQQEQAERLKAEREQNATNESIRITQTPSAGKGQKLAELVYNKQFKDFNALTDSLIKQIASGAVTENIIDILYDPYKRRDGKLTSVAEEMGEANAQRILTAVDTKARANQDRDRQDLVRSADAYVAGLMEDLRNDPNGKPPEYFERAAAAWAQANNGQSLSYYNNKWDALTSTYSNEKVQEKKQLEEAEAAILAGTFVPERDLPRLTSTNRVLVNQILQSDPTFLANKQTKDKNHKVLEQLAKGTLRALSNGEWDDTVILKGMELIGKYDELVRKGASPDDALAKVAGDHKTAFAADKGKTGKDRKYSDGQTGYLNMYPGSTGGVQQALDRNEKIKDYNEQYPGDELYKTDLVSYQELEDHAKRIAQGDYTFDQDIKLIAKRRGVMPLVILREFAANNTQFQNSKYKSLMDFQPPIIIEQLTPQEIRRIEAAPSVNAASRQLSAAVPGLNLPVLQGQPVRPAGQQTPAWSATGSLLAWAEGGDYNVMFGGGRFEDFSRHPDTVVTTARYASAAAGKYQFMPNTYAGAAAALGLKDFSPESQEAAGRYLTEERGVDPDAIFTSKQEFAEAMYKLSPEWASIPQSNGRSYYGQPVRSIDELWAKYQQFVRFYGITSQ